MKALVTGACGFVGSYLVKHLMECGDDVVGTYIGEITLPIAGCCYLPLDITNKTSCEVVIGDHNPDVIYHLAGIAFVPEAEKNFDHTFTVHVSGLNNILEACVKTGKVVRVLLTSSAEVYGKVDPRLLPVTEETPVNPLSVYSLSKVCSELVAQKFHANEKIHSVIARPFNHIGPGQNNRFVASDFAYQIAQVAKGKRAPEMYVGNLAVHRDFSDVRDIVHAYRLAAMNGTGIYNLSSGIPIAIKDILNTLIEVSEIQITVHRDPGKVRVAERPIFYGSSSRAENELGWRRKYTIKETLKEIYQYWLERV